MQDIIATMQKHINKQFSQDSMPYTPCESTQQSIHKFSEDIKGANEFIGALQTANVACKKILKLAQNLPENNLLQDLQEIIDNSAFMGVKLFNTQLSTTLNATTYTFCIDNPMPLLQEKDSNTQEAFIAYIEEKSQEITQLLLTLSDALVESTQSSTQTSGGYNFNEFNAKAFSQMLKG